MPEMLIDLASPEDGMRMIAAMLRPWDDKWQERFVRSTYNRSVLNVAKSAGADRLRPDAVQTVVDAATGERFEDVCRISSSDTIVSGYPATEMSGRLLLFVLACKHHDPANASLEYAYDQFENAFVAARLKGGSRATLTDKVWKKYRGVAHLWAAKMLNPSLWVRAATDPAAHLEWLACAEWFRQEAISHKPPHSATALVPPMATWRVVPKTVQLPKTKYEMPSPQVLIEAMAGWRDQMAQG